MASDIQTGHETYRLSYRRNYGLPVVRRLLEAIFLAEFIETFCSLLFILSFTFNGEDGAAGNGGETENIHDGLEVAFFPVFQFELDVALVMVGLFDELGARTRS